MLGFFFKIFFAISIMYDPGYKLPCLGNFSFNLISLILKKTDSVKLSICDPTSFI